MSLKQPRYQKYRDSRNLFSNVFEEYKRPKDYWVMPISLEPGNYYLSIDSHLAEKESGFVIGIVKYGETYTEFQTVISCLAYDGNIRNIAISVDSTWTDPHLVVYLSGSQNAETFNSLFAKYDVQLNAGTSRGDYEPYGAKIPDGIGENADIVPFHSDHRPVEVSVGRKSTNLIPALLFTDVFSRNGLTFEPQADGSIYIHGTSTAQSDSPTLRFDLPPGKYFVRSNIPGCQLYFVYKLPNGSTRWGTGAIEVEQEQTGMYAYLSAMSGVTIDGYAYPMINEGSTALPFERPGTVTDPLYAPRLESKSGATIEFEDSYNYECEVEVDGKSEQKQLSGKNLVDVLRQPTFNNGASSYNINNDSVTISNERKNTWCAGVWVTDIIAVEGQSFTVSGNVVKNMPEINVCIGVANQDGTNRSADIASLTVSSNAKFSKTGTVKAKHADGRYIGVWLYTNLAPTSTSSGEYPEATFSNIQLELGNQATPYEPYCGGVPSPNPDYPQPIESIESVEIVSKGRNLLNGDSKFCSDGRKSGDGSWFSLSRIDGYDCSKIVMAKEHSMIVYKPITTIDLTDTDTRYIMSGWFYKKNTSAGTKNPYLSLYFEGHDLNGNWAGTSSNITDISVQSIPQGVWTKCSVSFKLSKPMSNATLDVYARDFDGELYFRDIMFEVGNMYHDYEPYHSVTRNIDLQGNKLCSRPNGVKNILNIYNDGRVEIKQNILHLRLAIADMNNSDDYPGWRFPVGTFRHLFGGINEYVPCTNSAGIKYSVYAPNSIGVNTLNSAFDTLFYFKTSMGMNQTEIKAKYPDLVVDYLIQVKQPQTIQLPSIDPIPQYYPTTILDGNGNDITGYVTVVDV